LRLLAREGSRGGLHDLAVPFDDVELGPIVDFRDANKVAQLLFMPDSARRLACHKDISETPLIVVRPLIMNLLSGVEEAGHGGDDGSDAAGEGGRGMVELCHRRNVGTVATDSYRSYRDHNPQPRNVGCARNHDGPNRWCAINNNAKSVGDQTTAIEVWLPNTMEHPVLPLS